ncbi:MAG: major facilitator superfamily 1 [Paucimonas sp.]|nr:major facilitator superfamily 1 [Paucimonas sp.]
MSTLPKPLAQADWIIALGLSFGSMVSLALSRMSYGMLLPPMRADLHWTYALAAGINTANALGYVAGAIGTGWLARRYGLARCFVACLGLSALSILAMALASDYLLLSLLRAFGGIVNAPVFILGAALAASISTSEARRSSLLVALYFSGIGSGIALSGLLIPATQAVMGADAWRSGWAGLGILSLLLVLPASMAARCVTQPGQAPATVLSSAQLGRLWPSFIGYLLFGAGAMSYMTFVVAFLQREGFGTWTVAAFWILLGVSSALMLRAWGRWLDGARGARGLAAASAVTLAGSLPVLLAPGLGSAFVFALVFGGSIFAAPTAITVMIRRLLPQASWTAAMAGLTVAFSVGQMAGPLVAGIASDRSGHLSTGLWLSSALLLAAGLFCMLQTDAPAP